MSQPDRRAQRRVTIYRARDNGSDEIWQVEYDSVAFALHFACRDLREGRRTPIVILQDGALIYDAEAIAAACAEDQAHDELRKQVLLEANRSPNPNGIEEAGNGRAHVNGKAWRRGNGIV